MTTPPEGQPDESPLRKLLAGELPCNDGTTDHDLVKSSWNEWAFRCSKCGAQFERSQ